VAARWRSRGRIRVGGGDEVPGRRKVVAKKVLVRRHIGAGGRGIRHRSVAHAVGDCGSGTACSPVGAAVVASVGASRCEVTRAARHRSILACRERWPERRWHRGVEGPATSAWAGAGAATPGATGTGPGRVDHHG
jgi:hypothetical protein